MMHDNTTHRSRIITSGQDLCDLLVSHARREAMYPPCILDLTEQVLNHLAEDGDMEDLIEEDLSPFRQLANAVQGTFPKGRNSEFTTALSSNLQCVYWTVESGALWWSLPGCWALTKTGLHIKTSPDRGLL